MNNEITITLTGSSAQDYIRNTALDEASISMLQEENGRLIKALEALQIKYDTLASQQNQYQVAKENPSIRLQHDTDLMKDSQYEKKSPFKRPVKTESSTLDEEWRIFVDLREVPKLTRGKWDEKDSKAVKNAIDKTNKVYYSIKTLSKFLGRSEQSIMSRAIKTYGAHIRNGMIMSEI